MRQSVANVQHTIEAQLMPMITARQSVIEQGFDLDELFRQKFFFDFSSRTYLGPSKHQIEHHTVYDRGFYTVYLLRIR